MLLERTEHVLDGRAPVGSAHAASMYVPNCQRRLGGDAPFAASIELCVTISWMLDSCVWGVSLFIVVLGATVGCGSEDPAEKNRRQILADEAACKDALADHDAWSTATLSERCKRIANIHYQRRKNEELASDAANARKAAELVSNENEELDKAAGTSCVAKAQAKRDAWLDKQIQNDDYMVSPRDEGFRIAGRCSQKLVQQSLDCSDANIRTVNGDSPWLSEAHRLGFTRFVCNEVDHLSKDQGVVFRRTVEMPLDLVIVTRRAHSR